MGKVISSSLLFWMVSILIASNLFSQAVYMGFNGVPYSGIEMIQSLGPWYYVLVGLEIIAWMYVGIHLSIKLIRNLQVKATPQTTS
jgi:hypothetical protein